MITISKSQNELNGSDNRGGVNESGESSVTRTAKSPNANLLRGFALAICIIAIIAIFAGAVWGKYAQDLSVTTELKVTISDYTINKTKMQTVIKNLSTKPTAVKFVTGASVPEGLTNLATTTAVGADTAGIQQDDSSMIGVFQDGTTLYIAPMNSPAASDSTGVAATAANNSYVMHTPVDASSFFNLVNMGFDETTNKYDTITELDLGNLDTSKTENMSRMFYLCQGVTSIDVSKFDTSKVTNMSDMFYYMSSLTTLDVSKFDTSNVTDMRWMFQRCLNLESITGLNTFNTEKVTQTNVMFSQCEKLKSLDLSSFNMSLVTSMSNMFYACNMLQEITLGENFEFKGTDGYLPEPSTTYITGADGKWYDNETSEGYAPADLASHHKEVGETRTYTAVPTTNYYWLAAAGADDPSASSGILKKQSEVDEDMAVLHGTKAKTSAGKDKAAVATEWEGYMNGNTRLYTKWYGSDAGTGANQWVEFRIIQVGDHDGDGSAVTFMATHVLPTSKQMKEEETNADGWEKSYMRNTIMTDYVAAGLKDVEGSALEVSKTNTSGNSDDGWIEAGADTSDKFWLLSNSEVFGTDDNNTFIEDEIYYVEGSQYEWFSEQGVNAKNGSHTTNSSIASMYLTRSGSKPDDAYYTGGWWLRSPTLDEYDKFCYIDPSGKPSPEFANSYFSVVPAFAL